MAVIDRPESGADPMATDWDEERVRDRRRRFLSPSLDTFAAFERPLVLRRGERQYVWDTDGKRYLDCLAQNLCISVGYAHPVVTEAAREQMESIQHVTTMYYHPMPAHFAEELVARMPEGPDWVVHLVNSGAEAVDLAFLLARLYTGCHEVLALRHSYHGLHFGAMAATGLSLCHQPVAPASGFVHVDNPDQFRGAFGLGVAPYVEALQRTIDTATSGRVAGLIAEPIQGFGGVVPLPDGYLAQAADVVRAAGGLTIIDEVQTGFGRTGGHFWGCGWDGVVPDIAVMSKGIGNGWPLAAVVTRREIAETMSHHKFFNTYGSNPVASAVGRAVLKVIDDEGLQENAKTVGGLFRAALERVQARHDCVGDVRGKGLMLGVELVRDRESKTPAPEIAGAVQEGLREEGVIVGRSGQHKNCLRVNPPLCVNEADAEHLERAFAAAVERAAA